MTVRPLLVLLSCALLACGGEGGSGAASVPPGARVSTLPSGRQLVALGLITMRFQDGSPPGLMLKYQTTYAMTDTANLVREAEDIWTSFRHDVEGQGYSVGILSATTPMRGTFFQTSQMFTFVYERQPDGSWRRK